MNITKTGTGTVTSLDGRIHCGITCQSSFTSGTIVKLTAASDTGSTFGAWGGACAGTLGVTCTLTMDMDKAVMATFTTAMQDVTPPTTKISFPPLVSMTDAAQITVRGTATDETEVSSVFVNGIAASTSDGSANWQAVVPLNRGNNTLVVATSDTLGNTNTNAASANMKRQIIASSLADVALDVANNRILVSNFDGSGLVSIDLSTGNRSILSGAATGTGPNFIQLAGVVLDEVNNRVLVADFNRHGANIDRYVLFAVDLITGNRNLLFDVAAGTGPKFGRYRDSLALDVSNNRVLMIDFDRSAILEIDLTTGNRSILSNSITGTGPNFVTPTGADLDAAKNRVLVTDFDRNVLFAVDLLTGNRNILSDVTTGTGIGFNFPQGVTLDTVNNLALVENGRDALLAVDLVTGNRSIISDAATGTGIRFSFPQGVTLNRQTTMC